VVQLGASVRGRPISARVFGGTGPPVLILGGIHGDEPSSVRLVERLARRLEREPRAAGGRKVVLIPRANPDGLAAGTRGNARGVDVNRNFPAANFRRSRRHGSAPLSEPEAAVLAAAIRSYGPSCVVSVHGPLKCIDPDGGPSSDRLARAMANLGPLPVKDLPAHAGSLGSYAGQDLGLTMITVELERKRLPARGAEPWLNAHLPALLLAIREG
jgi:protein MpaA